jgi:Ni/Co efflux regulator RcnB
MNARLFAAGVIAISLCTATSGASAKGGELAPQAGTEQQAPDQVAFTAQDRQATRDWYTRNRTKPPAGFRQQDQLSADLESQLQVGTKLDSDLQRMIHTMPTDLEAHLAAPPRGYRHVAIGGQIALVDKDNQVYDVIYHP